MLGDIMLELFFVASRQCIGTLGLFTRFELRLHEVRVLSFAIGFGWRMRLCRAGNQRTLS